MILGFPARRRVCSQLRSWGDSHGQTLGHYQQGKQQHLTAYMQHTHRYFYIWGKHTAILDGTQKSNNENLVSMQREGPEHHFGFTVNRKHTMETLHKSLQSLQLLLRNYPQLATQLLHQKGLRWPFSKCYWHASTTAELQWGLLQGRASCKIEL